MAQQILTSANCDICDINVVQGTIADIEGNYKLS